MSNQQRSQGPIPIPSQEMVTGNQLANLLNVAGLMVRALEGEGESAFQAGKSSPIDGGAKMAAEQTFVKVCQRIDDILDERYRWKTTERDALLLASLDLVQQNTEFLKTQTIAAASLLRPSYRFNPTLTKLPDGIGWAVFLGNTEDPDSAIVGVGNTPDEAYRAFDDIFTGTANEKMKQWALAREKEIDENATKTLDSKRVGEPESDAGKTKPHAGNRRNAGKKHKSGGAGNL